jgi:2-aminoethylphosphonate-pyruvate transaminase
MIEHSQDKLLFTPGPLTTSPSVKQAMLHDAGSWHFEFAQVVKTIREGLLRVAGVGEDYAAVLLQGSGTYGVEAVLGSAIPAQGKALIVVNGAYGERMAKTAAVLQIPHEVFRCAESATPDPAALDSILRANPALTHVAMVHCETTTGILNPIEPIGRLVAEHHRVFIVDAMSSFGAVPIDARGLPVDFLISSANKGLEGVPGFCFVIAPRHRLLECEGRARSLSLDLFAQWQGFEKNGQFRFTPPTHALLAFAQALREFEAEGGVPARGARYAANHATLLKAMGELGFKPFLPAACQSYIITAFGYPVAPSFHFPDFYRQLSDRGMIIYPGKLTQLDTFRIGTIGRLFPEDLVRLAHAVEDSLQAMGCPVPVTPGVTG